MSNVVNIRDSAKARRNRRNARRRERRRVEAAYEEALLESHRSDLLQVRELAASWPSFPARSEDLLSAVVSSYPGNVMVRAGDRAGILRVVRRAMWLRGGVRWTGSEWVLG